MSNNFIENLNYVSLVRKHMNEQKLMLSYRGEMTQDIVIALLNLTENKLNQSTLSSTIKTRVFSVMVECLQNITHYTERKEHTKSNMFMVGSSDDGYMVYSGNVVRNKDVDDLKNRIQEINTMSEEDLKKSYKNLIKDESSEQSGFGLGLIHIARRTGNALDFDFEQIDSDHYFFSLSTLVDH